MFRIGEKIICIDASPVGPRPFIFHEMIVEGRVYTVRGSILDSNGRQLVYLAGVKNAPVMFADGFVEPPFPHTRFRKVVELKTDISIFTAMLTPSPVTVDAMNVADHAREIVR